MISANVIAIVLETNSCSLAREDPNRVCPKLILSAAEYSFVAFYIIEFFLKLGTCGVAYYKPPNFMNMFDAFLVWVPGVLVVYILEPTNVRLVLLSEQDPAGYQKA